MPLAPGESPAAPVDHQRDALAAIVAVIPIPHAVAAIEADGDLLPSALADRLERPPRGC